MTVCFGELMPYKGSLQRILREEEKKPFLSFSSRCPSQHDGHLDELTDVIYLPSQATLILPSMMSFLI